MIEQNEPVVGIVLHVFHEHVAVDILDRLKRLERPFRLFITSSIPIGPRISDRAYDLVGNPWMKAVPNRGRDVEPFLNILPELYDCDYILKLHSKDISTPIGKAWYLEMVEALIGSPAVYDAVLDAFETHQWLRMVGPKATWLSAQQFMYENREAVEDLQKAVYGKVDKSDWGFFAGTMFWYRRPAFSALQNFWRDAISFEQEAGSKDGKPEHAVERFMGYCPRDVHHPVGMVTATGPVIEYDLPPSKIAISKALTERHGLIAA